MAENIGALFPTKIPGYEESADIKEAIRLYHYGAPTGTGVGEYNPNTQDLGDVVRNSIAGQFKYIDEELADLKLAGIGSSYTATAPTLMPNGDPLPDGYIWVESDSTASVLTGTVANYQTTAPVDGIVDGTLWVDKSTMTLKVYDAADEEWKVVG
jgi:hypothetical protein